MTEQKIPVSKKIGRIQIMWGAQSISEEKKLVQGEYGIFQTVKIPFVRAWSGMENEIFEK